MSTLRMNQFYKTKMCPWYFKGRCERGNTCRFAHSHEELRTLPNLSKTSLCPQVIKNGECPTRETCRFAHSFAELRATDDLHKTSLCFLWMRGRCDAGSECRHAHGIGELRAVPNSSGGNDDVGPIRRRGGKPGDGFPQSLDPDLYFNSTGLYPPHMNPPQQHLAPFLPVCSPAAAAVANAAMYFQSANSFTVSEPPTGPRSLFSPQPSHEDLRQLAAAAAIGSSTTPAYPCSQSVDTLEKLLSEVQFDYLSVDSTPIKNNLKGDVKNEGGGVLYPPPPIAAPHHHPAPPSSALFSSPPPPGVPLVLNPLGGGWASTDSDEPSQEKEEKGTDSSPSVHPRRSAPQTSFNHLFPDVVNLGINYNSEELAHRNFPRTAPSTPREVKNSSSPWGKNLAPTAEVVMAAVNPSPFGPLASLPQDTSLLARGGGSLDSALLELLVQQLNQRSSAVPSQQYPSSSEYDDTMTTTTATMMMNRGGDKEHESSTVENEEQLKRAVPTVTTSTAASLHPPHYSPREVEEEAGEWTPTVTSTVAALLSSDTTPMDRGGTLMKAPMNLEGGNDHTWGVGINRRNKSNRSAAFSSVGSTEWDPTPEDLFDFDIAPVRRHSSTAACDIPSGSTGMSPRGTRVVIRPPTAL